MARRRVKIRDSDPGFRKAIAKFGKGTSVTKIGLFSDKHDSELLLYASVNEFGTDRAGRGNATVIPERSYLRATVDQNRKKIIAIIKKGKEDIVAGRRTKEAVLREVGFFVEGEVKQRISRGIAPVNKPSTIRAKGSSTTLIDSGRLRQSIIHIVEKEGLI